MPIENLLINRCSWRRRINIGENDYGEIEYSDLLIASDVPCSRQVGPGMNMRQLLQDQEAGEYNKKIIKYWIMPTDIQEGDIIKYLGSETEKVKDVRDAAGRGDHYEVITEGIEEVGEEDFRIG